jgi:hypothetical protein|tara:strand:- start:157 stop:354 length:198 start_codon:yes stop_codon:yes gene_type:complete
MIPEQNVHHISNIKLGQNPSSRLNPRKSKFDVMEMRPAGVKKSLKVIESNESTSRVPGIPARGRS